jgi:hypothetical protein
VFEHAFDFICDGHRSEDNYVGMCSGWANVTFSHRRNGLLKLFDYGLGSPATLSDVAVAAALETDIVGHVDVDTGAKMMPQFEPMQSKKTLKITNSAG